MPLEYRLRNNDDHKQDELDADDFCDVRCAEIYITQNRVVLFHCLFCGCNFGSVEYLLEHFATHYVEIKKEGVEIYTESDNYECKILEEQIKSEFSEEIKEEYLEEEAADDNEVLPFEEIVCEDDYDKSEEKHTVQEENVAVKTEAKRRGRNTLQRNGELKCDKCNRKFPSKTKLRQHETFHFERIHKCHICGFAFKQLLNLNNHLRRHTDEKNVSCEICSKKFFTNSEAEIHMRSHTGERPYVCSYCGESFKTSSRMTAHAKRHTETAPFKCEFCGKELWRKAFLEDHLLVHTKEKPFGCTICGRRFPRHKSMMRHMELHEKS